ncbi:methyl-accepting chemotaxis protein [Albimonas pacifica]|uniref:Methyl-accepting chemotaxis protein n=1 Tax=Albimonas pacifica TaxID=1114924 RepID=A0A1I3LU61_9RHOB|nr:methyl-accepting chemotaxis protein [Albimonas pacifica]SFI88279.1 methyl-accepting chemotaxis protein [Albimonas pacifica]
MTIRARILRLTPAAVAILAAIAVTIVAASVFEGAARDRQAEAQRRLHAADMAQLGFLGAAEATLRFAAAPSDAIEADYRAEMSRADAAVAELAQGGAAPEAAAIAQALERHRALFDELVAAERSLGYDETAGLEGALRASVHAAETRLEEIGSPELTAKMLMMRRHEKDFMLRSDPEYVARLDARIGEFAAFPSSLFASPAARDGILDLLAAYRADFHRFAEVRAASAGLQVRMSETLAGAAPAFRALTGAARAEASAADEAAGFAATARMAGVAVSVVLGIAAMTVMTRRLAAAVSRPLSDTASALSDVADGRPADMRGRERADEIGDIARAFDRLQERLRREAETREAELRETSRRDARRTQEEAEAARAAQARTNRVIEAIGRALDQLAAGDLGARMGAEVDGEFAALREAFDDTLMRLSDLVRRIKAASAEIVSATEGFSAASRDLGERTSRQAASLEETAATVEQISATIRSSADSARHADAGVREAAQRADRGGVVVRDAVEAMGRIEDSAGRISEINAVIDSIAFQTNLLALNAAVEAARAGEAGKGFAVVASEVRTLAQRSADAARDISALIGESAGHVDHGARLVRETGDALAQIEQSISAIVADIAGISSASAEQATAVTEIGTTISGLDDATQRNAQTAEDGAARAGALAAEARALNALVDAFTLDAAPRRAA